MGFVFSFLKKKTNIKTNEKERSALEGRNEEQKCNYTVFRKQFL
jgi:hypothetical protein